jgi:membrane protein
LNTIWKVPPAAEGQTKAFLVNRLISFVMVLCAGILILVISLSNLLISFFDSLLQLQLDVPYLNVGTNWLIYAAAIALTFRFLPDARISWKAASVGAGVTALLLLTGTKMLGWYLARGQVGSAFEAAGTMAVLLIAIYFLAQFFVFGSVLTRVFAEFYGGGIQPRSAAGS